MQQSCLLCISTLLESGNRKPPSLPTVADTLLTSPTLCRRLQQDVRPQGSNHGRADVWCVLQQSRHHVKNFTRSYVCAEQIAITLVRTSDGVMSGNVVLTLLFAPQVCDACLATDHPERYVALNRTTHYKGPLDTLSCSCAGARTSWPRYVLQQDKHHDRRSCFTRVNPVQMPRWLSSQKMEVVRSLLAEDPVRVSSRQSPAKPTDQLAFLFGRRCCTPRSTLTPLHVCWKPTAFPVGLLAMPKYTHMRF